MPASHLNRLVAGVRHALDPALKSDRELLDRFIAEGDPAAFEALVRRHGSQVLAVCQRVLPGPDADDAFQATFLALARDARRVRTAVGGWLVAVAHRVAVRLRAAERRRQAVEPRHPGPAGDDRDLSWREACAVLHQELDRLPDRYRRPLVLCYLRGLSRDEAATELGCTAGVLKGNLERGRTQLRTRLARRGLTLSTGLLAALPAVASVVPPRLLSSVLSRQPSAAAAGVVHAIRPAGPAWKAAGLVGLAAALTLAVGLGADGLSANPMPTKEMPAKAGAKADPGPKVADADAPERLSMSGRVLDPDGKPVAGAKVWLLVQFGISPKAAVGPKVVATTDADGRFAVTDDGRGRGRHWTNSVRVVATATGFGLAFAAVGPKADKPVELKMVKDEPVRGRLLTLEGKPVVGAKVRVQEVATPVGPDLSKFVAELNARERAWHTVYHEYFHYEGRLFQTGYPVPGQPEWVETDADGRFTLTGLGRERLAKLHIEGPTIATAELPVLTRAVARLTVPEDPGERLLGTHTFHGSTFDHPAEPTQPFAGVVTDRGTGKPVVGVRVRGRNHRLQLEVTTDRDGRYRLTGLPPGKHELVAIPADDQPFHRMSASGGVVASARPATVDFALTRGHWVTGKLVNARTGKPEAGAPVWYLPLADEPAYESVPGSQAWVHEPTTFAAADGSFRVIAFACRGAVVVNGFAGDYMSADQRPLQGDADSLDRGMRSDTMIPTSPVVHLGSYHAAAIVNVDPMRPKEYTVTLDPGVTVGVKVVDRDGKPVTGVGVGGLSTWSLWAPNQKAEVELTQYNPDRPRALVFLHPDRGLGKLVEPKKGDVGPWTVTLEPTGTAAGRLVTADDKPVANAVLEVHYLKPGQDAWSPAFARVVTRTDEAGRFRVTNLVAGLTYSFDHRTQPGVARQHHTVRVTVKAGETKDLGDVKPAGGD